MEEWQTNSSQTESKVASLEGRFIKINPDLIESFLHIYKTPSNQGTLLFYANK